MAKAPRITFLQPDPVCTPNRLETWFSDLGLRTSVVPLNERDVPQLSAAGDGLVILGGRMNALDTKHHRWLDPLGDLLAPPAPDAPDRLSADPQPSGGHDHEGYRAGSGPQGKAGRRYGNADGKALAVQLTGGCG